MPTDVQRSNIDTLKARVTAKNYSQYLYEMDLIKLRALQNQNIRFDFPVTALIGTNGGGKSTVLGAAAMAYKAVRPGEYFPKSNVGDNSMADWRVEYDLIDRKTSKSGIVKRNARFIATKWRRDDLLNREVLQFPIKRTVPAGEQTKYKRFIGIKKLKAKLESLPEEVASNAGRILAKDLSAYQLAKLKSLDKDYLLLGALNGQDFSQFHFGAGEASIIEMVLKIEKSPDYSLIVIEEIENGLHPIATEKMVEYLIGVAERKKIQVVFTTHSEHALKRLPPEAKWACIDGRVVQGDLSIESLRAINGKVDRDRVIFVEDDFAKDWVEDTLRQYAADIMPRVEVHKAGGYPFCAQVTESHNSNPSIASSALAIIDGDAGDDKAQPDCVVRLPGKAPENEVWAYISANSKQLAALIQQRCHVPQISQDDIVKEIKAVDIDQGDTHLNFRKLGDRIGFISELVVRQALISIYNQNNMLRLEPVISRLKSFAKA